MFIHSIDISTMYDIIGSLQNFQVMKLLFRQESVTNSECTAVIVLTFFQSCCQVVELKFWVTAKLRKVTT